MVKIFCSTKCPLVNSQYSSVPNWPIQYSLIAVVLVIGVKITLLKFSSL